jgi:L-ribulose-5-phosphate 3-epimerase
MEEHMEKLRLGVIVGIEDGAEGIRRVRRLGLPTCQVGAWYPRLFNDENFNALSKACKEEDVEITTLWNGYPGPGYWNLIEGPATIGFVPPAYREMRIDCLKRGADFAKALGVASITTHAGFIPESPFDPLYPGTIAALTEVANHCLDLGLLFCFETGQETPVTLRRMMFDVGTNNLGINLDPANLMMYGKANPVDALDLLGPYVKGVHCKDGDYPTEPRSLGPEKPLGEGRVNFPVLIPKLKSFGFTGALTIEREISGEQQITDIKRAMEILEPLL